MAVLDINTENYQSAIVDNDQPAIIDFWATWCPHCKRIAPVYEKLAGDEYLPTFVVLDKDGKALDSVIAPAGKAALQEFINKNLGI